MFPIFLVKIEGESGWPELIPEKKYLATSLLLPKMGDFIVFRNPKNKRSILVKKIREIKDGFYNAGGNVSWSSSSENFGLIKRKEIIGKLLFVNSSLPPIKQFSFKRKLKTAENGGH